MTIARIIEGRGPVQTCQIDTVVSEAAGILAQRRIGALPIMDGDTLVGIFSERDVLYRLHDSGPDMLQKPVAERAGADDPAPHPPPAGGPGRAHGRLRLDR